MAMQTGGQDRRPLRTPAGHYAERMANGLGWFSIGLGLAEILAPQKMARLVGLPDNGVMHSLIRSCGVREMAAGIGIVSRRRPIGWLWGRVGGDLLDMGLLEAGMFSKDGDRTRAAVASAAVLGVSALDLYCIQELKRPAEPRRRIRETKTVIVNRSPEEVYSFWHRLENFPKFMSNIESVQVTGDGRTHWRGTGPAGRTVEWNSEIVTDQPNTLIAWRSTPDSDMYHSGSVRFARATGARGTLVTVNLEYDPPGGPVGARIAKLFGAEPGQQVESALRRMKQILETGDVIRSEADIFRGVHAAQPPEAGEPGARIETGERKEATL